MKTIANTSKDASSMLVELLDFKGVAQSLARAAGPYTKFSNGRPLPKFVTDTSMEMRKTVVANFKNSYPHLALMIENGTGSNDASFQRIHDACFKFGEAQKALQAKRYMLMTDDDRRKIYGMFNQVVGDIVVFILIHFDFAQIRDQRGVMLCVQSHCEAHGISPDVLYALLLQDLSDAGESWYSYEPISPMYQALMEFDMSFAEECSSSNFKLVDSVTERLVAGELDIAAVRGACLEHAANLQEKDIDATPSSMISNMNLDG